MLTLRWTGDEQSGHIAVPFLLSIFRLVRLLLSGHESIAIENAVLRLQLAASTESEAPRSDDLDRVFWITSAGVAGWRGPLHYVQADTVVRWERERFRRF